jgi:hypothetical protein
MGAGRPTEYHDGLLERTTKLCLLGYTDAELADSLGVCEATINNWKNAHPQFLEAIKSGKENADCEVASALFERAKTTSDTAAIFWLKNRKSKSWADRKEVTGADGGPVAFTVKSILEETK